MEMENNALMFLRQHRYWILALMIAASLVNAFYRFTGHWQSFWTVLLLQAYFGQVVFAYLRGGTVQLAAGGGLSRDAHPLGRAALAAFALAVYLVSFGYEGHSREPSIHDKRPGDWTLPTRSDR
ncbi:hypothetical protein [Pseudomonas sp. IT-P12]|uniref:hypothetical protein n=1 Tax=Pseudomonas sp. IT-P12 TaxID=3026450 RepID=UPI0039E1FB61